MRKELVHCDSCGKEIDTQGQFLMIGRYKEQAEAEGLYIAIKNVPYHSYEHRDMCSIQCAMSEIQKMLEAA